jgi:hypothetical protein
LHATEVWFAHAYAGVAANLDQLFGLKVRINSFFASIPDQCCKVCHILGERTTSTCGAVCKKFAGGLFLDFLLFAVAMRHSLIQENASSAFRSMHTKIAILVASYCQEKLYVISVFFPL